MLLPVIFLCIGWCYCQCICGRSYNHIYHWGWCYCLLWCFLLLADVMPMSMWKMLCPHIATWEDMADVIANMSVADVITTGADVIASYVYLFCYWLMLLPMCGRWYSHFCVMWWLMLLPSGRWNGHYRVGGIKLADVIANWQMLLPRVIIVLF